MERVLVKNISKKFKIGYKRNQTTLERVISLFSGKESKKTIYALKRISFKVEKGKILGIIGKNGSGKTTLLRIISGIYKQDKGEICTDGNIVSLIGLGGGMKERLTMKENIYLVGSLFGLKEKEIKKKFNSIVKFAELENFIDTKVYQFSLGMSQRLVFSIAIHCNPEILLLDEVFAVGDEEFGKKSVNKIKELIKKGTSIILASHKKWLIEKYCDRIIWLDRGKIVKQGDTKEVVKEYFKH